MIKFSSFCQNASRGVLHCQEQETKEEKKQYKTKTKTNKTIITVEIEDRSTGKIGVIE